MSNVAEELKAKTTITLVTNDEENAENLINLFTEKSAMTRSSAYDRVTKNVWDDTYGVKVYLTVYYVEGRFSTGQDSLLVTGVDGGAKITDSNIQIVYNSDNKLVIGCSNSSPNLANQQKKYTIKSISFSKSTPSNWKPMDISQSICGSAGAIWEIPLRRANIFWDMSIGNMLYGQLNVY